MLARVGEADLAAHVLVIRVVLVSFLPGLAIAEASGVLVGQAIGAGRIDEARDAWRAGLGLAVAVMATGGVAFLLFPTALLAVFDAEPAVVAIGRELLVVAAAFQVFDAIATVALMALNGAGDTRFTMVTNVAAAWLVKVPVGTALALGLGLGATGAWLGLTAEIVVLSVLWTWRVRGVRWTAHTVLAAQAA